MIFVDELVPTAVTKDWPYASCATLFATTEIDLKNVATLLGLQRKWCRKVNGRSTYNLTEHMRRQAISKGVIPLDAFGAMLFRELVGRFKGLASANRVGLSALWVPDDTDLYGVRLSAITNAASFSLSFSIDPVADQHEDREKVYRLATKALKALVS